MILRCEEAVPADQVVDAAGGLGIGHVVDSRVVRVSAVKDNTFRIVISIGIIRAGKRMAASTGPVLVLEELRALLCVLMPEKEGIGRDPSVGIGATRGEKCIGFLLSDENGMFFPGKAIPCVKENLIL